MQFRINKFISVSPRSRRNHRKATGLRNGYSTYHRPSHSLKRAASYTQAEVSAITPARD